MLSAPRPSPVPEHPSPERTRPGAGLLDVETDVRGSVATVRVRGEIDLATRDRLAAALTAALDALRRSGPSGRVDVDLRGVAFVDARGLAVLARTVQQGRTRGLEVRLLTDGAFDATVDLVGGWGVVDDATGAAEYDHLMPLFAERAALPADHPRHQELRSALITGYLPVARHIARKHSRRGESIEDLEQVATVGLINAVDRFEVERGYDFLAFAIPTVTGEVQRHFRDRTSTIRMPRRVRELQSTVLRAVDELQSRDGRSPRPSDIARHLDLGLGEVVEALEANHRSHCLSLDEPFPGSDPDAESARFAGATGVRDHDLGLVDDRESLGPLLDALPERERRIVLLRFFGNRTQSQIGAELGISQMHVSRLLVTILAQLRDALEGRRDRRS
jgi:RNA polymerase sigma-B factor